MAFIRVQGLVKRFGSTVAVAAQELTALGLKLHPGAERYWKERGVPIPLERKYLARRQEAEKKGLEEERARLARPEAGRKREEEAQKRRELEAACRDTQPPPSGSPIPRGKAL